MHHHADIIRLVYTIKHVTFKKQNQAYKLQQQISVERTGLSGKVL